MERRVMLCGLPHEQLIEAPKFDWEVERAAATAAAESGGSGSGDAVSITWSNRGQASDGFSTFGTSAAAGRAVVDAVLAQWSRIISSWNRADGTVTLQVNISMASGFGFGGAASPASTAPADGKPRTGSITINQGNNDGNANSSNGWFFDPTPMDNAEFLGNINHAYNLRATNPSQGVDFFSVVNLELAHVLGIISDRNNSNPSNGWNGYRLENMVTSTGIRDNAEGGGSFGFFYVFDGPNIDHLMTGYNSGDATSASWGNVIHTSGPGNINFAGRNWVGIDDDSNAIFNGAERVLPSFVVARILADAYGYSIVDPATFATAHTVLNQSTGALTIRGGQSATSSDVIIIDTSGSDLVITVDVGDDVAGSGALSGAGNLPAYVTRVPLASVTSINVNGNGARDYLRIERTGGKPVTINGGDGDDFIDFSFYSRNLDTTASGSIYLQGGNGADYVYAYDDSNSVADTFTITSSRFDRPFWAGFSYASDIEGLNLITGTGSNTVNVESTWPNQPIVLNSTGGLETINIGNTSNGVQSIRADVQINNTPSYSTININNGPDTGNRDWLINDVTSTYGSIYGLAPAGIVWRNPDIDIINLTTGSGVDTGNIARLSETLNINNAASNPGGIYDHITIGNSSAGGLASITQGRSGGITIDNNPSYTRLVIDDNGSGTTRTATLDLVSSYMQLTGMAPATIRFDEIDTHDVTIRSGGAADTLTVARLDLGSTGALTINSAGGADTVNIGNNTDGVRSIIAPLTVRNTPSFTTLNINGNFDTTGRSMTIDYDPVSDLETLSNMAPSNISWDPGDIHFTNGVNLTTGSGQDTINVLANERTLNLSTAGNTESVVFGPNLDRINSDVYVRNSTSFTAITISDTAFGGGRTLDLGTATIGSEFFSRATGFGATLYVKAVDTNTPILVQTGGGNDTITVSAAANSFNVTAGAGDDVFNLGSATPGQSNIDPINAPVSLNGGIGADLLYVLDTNYGAAGSQINVNGSTITSDHTGVVTYGDISQITISMSNAGQTTNVQSALASTPVYIAGGTAHDFINVYNNASFVVVFNSGGLDDVAIDPLNNGSGGTVYLYETLDLGTLYLGTGARAQLSGPGVPTTRVTSANFAGGRLDLRNGKFIYNYTGASPIASIRNALLTGRNGGAWNGTGINSSFITSGKTIGYAEASEVKTSFPATFGGFSNVDNTSVLVGYTLLGDANLDNTVNFDDLLRLAQNYSTSATGRVWSQGDFNYDGVTNFDDLLALSQQYGNTALSADWTTATTRGLQTSVRTRAGTISDLI